MAQADLDFGDGVEGPIGWFFQASSGTRMLYALTWVSLWEKSLAEKQCGLEASS